MSYKDLQKDDRILEIVKYLFDKFGDDCDNSEKYLFYISTYNKQEDHYFISLENTTSGDDFPYESVGDFDEVKLNELERLFKQHLRI